MQIRINRNMNMKNLCKLNASYIIMNDDVMSISPDCNAELRVVYKPFTHEMEGLFGHLPLFKSFEQWLDCYFIDSHVQKLVDLKEAQDDFKKICGLIVALLQQHCTTHQKRSAVAVGSLPYEIGNSAMFINVTFDLK